MEGVSDTVGTIRHRRRAKLATTYKAVLDSSARLPSLLIQSIQSFLH